MNEKTSPLLLIGRRRKSRRRREREREEEEKFFSDTEQTNQINCLFFSFLEDNSFIFSVYHIRLYRRQTNTKQKSITFDVLISESRWR